MILRSNDRRHFGFFTFLGSWVPGVLVTIFVIFFLSGCQTASSVQNQGETREDVQEALSAVTGAISGKSLSKEELRNLEKQIRADKDAQTAVRAITGSVGGTSTVKYCPVTGRRYAAHLKICPEHGVELREVGDEE